MGEIGVPPALEAAVDSLKEAISAKRTDIVRKLLDACDTCDGGGKDARRQLINSHCTEDGGTFLHLATMLKHADSVRALLAGGGDPGVLNSKGQSPLQLAEADASIIAVYTEDMLRATAQSDLGRVCQLLAGGLSVNAQDNCISRNTPLHWAASFADKDTLHGLIARGASVHNVNSHGATPLHDAVARGDPAIIEALLQHGAKPATAKCSDGRHVNLTPLEMAEVKGGEVLQVMRKYYSKQIPKIESVNNVNGEVKDTSDMRALAGSLESLTSVGVDSVLLPSEKEDTPEKYTTQYNGDLHSTPNGSKGVHDSSTESSSNRVNRPLLNSDEGKVFMNGESKGWTPKMGAVGKPLPRSPIHSLSSIDFSPSMEETYARLVRSSTAPMPRIITDNKLNLLWPVPKVIQQGDGAVWTVPKTLRVSIIHGAFTFRELHAVVEGHRSQMEECGISVLIDAPLHHTTSHSASDVTICMSAAMTDTPLRYTLDVNQWGVLLSCGSVSSLHNGLTTLSQLLTIHSITSLQTTDDEITPISSKMNDVSISQQNYDGVKRGSGRKTSLLRQISDPSQQNIPYDALSRSQSIDGFSNPLLGNLSLGDGGKTLEFSDIEIESVTIEDCPDVANRAFMLDTAPLARVPTLNTLFHIVDSLAYLKINQFHMMMTVQHILKDNRSGGPDHTCRCHLPYTPDEIVKLSLYCSERGVNLVPAFDLDSSNSSSVLEICMAVSESLSYFDTPTVSLGPNLTSVLVYYSATAPNCDPWRCLGTDSSTTLILCSNVFQNEDAAELVQDIPMNVLLMEYGFQANYNFNNNKEFNAKRRGRPIGHCPGTAAWSSLAGFPEAGVSNVFRGCVSASDSTLDAPSIVVIAHWSTPASLTPLVFMWPPIVVCAGLSWNKQTHFDYVNSSLGVLVDTHLVKVPDCGFGTALVELGRCETWLTRQMRDQENTDLSNLPPATTGHGSTLHQLLIDPDSVDVENLKVEKFGSVLRHIKKSIKGIQNNRVVKSCWPLMPVAAAEINLTADLMMSAARIGRALLTVGTNPHSNIGMSVVNPGLTNLPATIRTDVANRVLSLRESYSCLWLHCHQPAGLQASLLLLSSLLSRLLPNHSNIQDL